jgi:hypothetical protein
MVRCRRRKVWSKRKQIADKNAEQHSDLDIFLVAHHEIN